ncbi:upstream stimulatory factor 2 [Gracilinanus agilis]|uniref:upstream stimulatory factor 2 n=1 Tax=Gracilinanus agilis TaxID=191870 RepID=UPI001CFF069E|nr:upstream stimulatory factor 2 [Gracilinanus agilis]
MHAPGPQSHPDRPPAARSGSAQWLAAGPRPRPARARPGGDRPSARARSPGRPAPPPAPARVGSGLAPPPPPPPLRARSSCKEGEKGGKIESGASSKRSAAARGRGWGRAGAASSEKRERAAGSGQRAGAGGRPGRGRRFPGPEPGLSLGRAEAEARAEEQTAVAIASVQQAAFGEHNIQYQFRTENNGGQVTYRVVQVTDGQLDGQGDTTGAVSVVSTAAFTGGQQAVAQAVIQNPFSNGGSPAAEAVSGEARFAYFPASSVGDATAVSVQTTDQSLQAGGQFYVMMTPQDVLQTGTQRTIAPRTHPYSPKMDGTRTPRDERRRAQHNEVERRRRDKINNWIVQLSKIIPDCNTDNSKTGASKGGILSKACDYIRELRQTNQRMQETFKEAERLQMDNELLRQQIEELKNENALLRAQLQQHGLEIVGETSRQ